MFVNKLYFKEEKLKLISSFIKRMSQEASDGVVGYYALARKRPDLECFLENTKNIILVGMGGQSAGVKAVASALGPKKELVILDNISPSFVKSTFENIVLEKSIFIISSKSGSTVETMALLELIIKEFDIKTKDFSKYFLFITDEFSPLHEKAKQYNIKCCFMPANVGGRFSVFSKAGLVPLAMSGYDINSFLNGACKCHELFFSSKLDCILKKAYHYCTHKSARSNVLFSYDTSLQDFNEWYKQLIAESLGKKKGYKRMGITPISLIGSKDQHSFLQLIMDGPKDKSVTFIKIHQLEPSLSLARTQLSDLGFKKQLCLHELLAAQCDATAHALIAENISVDIIELDRLDAYHLGFMMYYYQLFTSSCALMMGINAYDQPGVEAGKIILKNMLK